MFIKKNTVILLFVILSACTSQSAPKAPAPPVEASIQPAETSPTPVPSSTPSLEPAATATSTPSPTATITPTITNTPVPWLRLTIKVENAVCHYGPGKPYLYKFAVHKGFNMQALSRDVTGTYMEIQAIGDEGNTCWVNAEYMDIQGDTNTLKMVQPEDVILPQSPYYAPPIGIKIEREGDEVNLIWVPLNLKAGDSSEQTPYIVEAWTCHDGQLSFEPIGTYNNRLVIQDEAGCAQASRARLLAAEKHGYTRPVEIDWPKAEH